MADNDIDLLVGSPGLVGWGYGRPEATSGFNFGPSRVQPYANNLQSFAAADFTGDERFDTATKKKMRSRLMDTDHSGV